jgi:hypothetical protein
MKEERIIRTLAKLTRTPTGSKRWASTSSLSDPVRTGPANGQSRIGGYASPAAGGRDASENDDYRVPGIQRRVSEGMQLQLAVLRPATTTSSRRSETTRVLLH